MVNQWVIYGCGGHARSVADIVLNNGMSEVLFIQHDAEPQQRLLGFPMQRELSDDHDSTSSPMIIGIGDNQSRYELFIQLSQKYKNFIPLISKGAFISKFAEIGQGTVIAHGAHLGPNSRVGENTILNTLCLVDHDCVIGSHTHIAVHATIAGSCKIGDFVLIGAGATVIDGIEITSNVQIGAGAVVTRSIFEPGIYVGIPAKKLK